MEAEKNVPVQKDQLGSCKTRETLHLSKAAQLILLNGPVKNPEWQGWVLHQESRQKKGPLQNPSIINTGTKTWPERKDEMG